LDAQAREHELVQRMIMAMQPSEDFTNTGVLKIRNAKGHSEFPFKLTIAAGTKNWSACYEVQIGTNVTDMAKLTVRHKSTISNHYELFDTIHNGLIVDGTPTTIPFAGSDFSVGDLGLEFLHWPQQKVFKTGSPQQPRLHGSGKHQPRSVHQRLLARDVMDRH